MPRMCSADIFPVFRYRWQIGSFAFGLETRRQGGNLLFSDLQAVVVMGVDDKPSLPKSHEASFGDEVLVTDNSVGRPTEEA